MAQRACAVDHSSGACAIEGAQAVSAQISAQMELSYTQLARASRRLRGLSPRVVHRRCAPRVRPRYREDVQLQRTVGRAIWSGRRARGPRPLLAPP